MKSSRGFVAILRDARLVAEELHVDRKMVDIIAARNNGRLSVNATTATSNEVRIGRSDGGGTPNPILVVKCHVSVKVRPKDQDEVLVDYSNQYEAIFEVIGGSEPVDFGNGAFDPTVLAPYIANTNWLAVRRADGSIAATAIAQLRLNLPEVSLERLVNQAVPKPDAAQVLERSVKDSSKKSRLRAPVRKRPVSGKAD